MKKIAVIGGSHFAAIKNLSITHSTTVSTPYGEPSSPLSYGILGEHEVVYLPRRGSLQPMPPHQINFRANIWALRDAGVQTVIATAAVAGIYPHVKVADVVVPDQLIDYTYGRENTFLGEDTTATHIDFSKPYSESLRKIIIQKAKELNFKIIHEATYGITQGPRFETSAEIKKLQIDGCHLVGMTGMPEAALARELDLDYACIALVVRQAGTPKGSIDTEKLEPSEKWVENLVEAIIMDNKINP